MLTVTIVSSFVLVCSYLESQKKTIRQSSEKRRLHFLEHFMIKLQAFCYDAFCLRVPHSDHVSIFAGLVAELHDRKFEVMRIVPHVEGTSSKN
jgi:hypothetical protein